MPAAQWATLAVALVLLAFLLAASLSRRALQHRLLRTQAELARAESELASLRRERPAAPPHTGTTEAAAGRSAVRSRSGKFGSTRDS